MLKKFELLVNLMEKKHREWQNLSVRQLGLVSGFTNDASMKALQYYRDLRAGIVRKPKKKQTKKKQTPKKRAKPVIRKSLSDVIKKKNIINTSRGFTKINEDTIEKVLLEVINNGVLNATTVRCLVDFYIKMNVKDDVIEDDIDMEALKQIGLSIKTVD